MTSDPAIPDPEERAARNAALFADNIETGFWDDQGRVAPRPDDIDDGPQEPTNLTPRTRAAALLSVLSVRAARVRAVQPRRSLINRLPR